MNGVASRIFPSSMLVVENALCAQQKRVRIAASTCTRDANPLWRFLMTSSLSSSSSSPPSSSPCASRGPRPLTFSGWSIFWYWKPVPPLTPSAPPTPRDVALFPLSDRWQQQHSPPLVSLIAALRDVWHLLRARTSCHHSAKYKRGISPFSAETNAMLFPCALFFPLESDFSFV